MFELSVIYKYLVPRWRQLSVSIIGLISICVIALVIWLVVVFFSVTRGLEKSWVQKLTALTAPIRIQPSEAYYRSYYYLIDGISAQSDYTLKTLSEKLAAEATDPYDPEADEEIPAGWPAPDRDSEGAVKDPVKGLFASLQTIPAISFQEFEITAGNLHLQVVRAGGSQGSPYLKGEINQPLFLSSAELTPAVIAPTLLKMTAKDVDDFLSSLRVIPALQEEAEGLTQMQVDLFRLKLKQLLDTVTITRVTTAADGWLLPHHFLPKQGQLKVVALLKGSSISRLIIPKEADEAAKVAAQLQKEGMQAKEALLLVRNGLGTVRLDQGTEIAIEPKHALMIPGEIDFIASVDKESWKQARDGRDILLHLSTDIQGTPLAGQAPLRHLMVKESQCLDCVDGNDKAAPLWIHRRQDADQSHYVLPKDSELGEAILLPKSFREAGLSVGDKGDIAYWTLTASSMQEQRQPIYIAGFYDPGIVSMGGRFALASPELVNLIRGSQFQSDLPTGNGINIRFDDLDRAEAIKTELQNSLKAKGIGSYWKIETFREFEFAKDLLQQLGSEKTLYNLIAGIVIIVACSNIISLLIILVNDKRKEIGILRSMGATSFSIALIFGGCGVLMGMVGSALGILLALLTLANLQQLVSLLSRLQGHEMFNPHFYGDSLPTDLSTEALLFVLAVTATVSLLAGLVPAVKACLMRPSEILRSE